MNQTTSLPPHKIIGVAVIWDEQGQILIDRRLPQGTMGGLWEFPGN
jgi:8-oxo-dGTP diphosphatase